MSVHPGWRKASGFFGAALACLLAAGLASAKAAEPAKTEGSLRWVPADAAFYNALFHNREQVQAVASSRAWAKLKALPAVQSLWKKAEEEWHKPGSPLAPVAQFFARPENRDLIELAKDMFGEEVFCFGGSNFGDVLEVLTESAGTMYYGALMARLTGQAGGVDPGALQARMLLRGLANNPKRIQVPDLVMGFRLTNTDRAEAQLKRLEGLLKALAAQAPPLKDRVRRAKVAGKEFLTVTLEGSQVPWDDIPLQAVAEQPGEFDELIKRLKQLKLTVAVGVRDQYLLVSLGGSTEQLARLGQGERLADRPEFKPLARFADKRLTSITYVSKALMARLSTSEKDIQGWVDMLRQGAKSANLPEKTRAQLAKDLDELSKDAKQFLSKPGASLSFSFLNGRGQESYSYDWGDHRSLDGSKPLTLLQHVGGSPLLAAVSRSKYNPDSYRRVVKWLKVGYGYFEEIALPQVPEVAKEFYDKFAKVMLPLLARLDSVTDKMLLPALADGQVGLVIDARQTSKQWVAGMPPSDKPLPLPAPALVFGVSDPALLRKAMGEYRTILNEMIAKVSELSPVPVPEISIPEPKTRQVKDGTLYYYDLPAELGLDAQFLPNAGLGGKVATLALTPAQSERLLERSAFKPDGGPLANLDRPLAGATYVSWSGLIDAVLPWVNYGLAVGGAEDEEVAQVIRTGLEVLKVLRSYTSASYFEEGALVTHAETVIKDL
jgi:hypothetical protein